MTDDPYFWQDDPWGEQDDERRRRWRRPWHCYLAIMLGFIGLVMLGGSFLFPGWHTVGAALVLLSVVAILRADGPKADRKNPRPPVPSLRAELTWDAVALALVVVGAVLFST